MPPVDASPKSRFRILVVELLEASPIGGDHLADLAEEVRGALRDANSVSAYADLRDLIADVEAGVLDLNRR